MANPRRDTGRVYVSDVLRGTPLDFPATKTLEDHLKKIDRDDIVYEDHDVIAYLQHDKDTGSTTEWDIKVAIALKTHVPTLLDIDVADHHSVGALLRAIQAVAFKLKLFEKGFDLRSDVLPPLQRRGYVEFKLRSGKHKNDGTPGDAGAPPPGSGGSYG
jgi:hypothetical protein